MGLSAALGHGQLRNLWKLGSENDLWAVRLRLDKICIYGIMIHIDL